MTYTFDEYEERCRFDAFCKVVLRHEAIDYFRELSRQRKRGIQFKLAKTKEAVKGQDERSAPLTASSVLAI